MTARRRPPEVAVRTGSQVTIRDIAKALDISHTTVSRALADHPHISTEMKVRVNETAKAMGYVVHSSARTMRGGPSSLVGLVIPDVQNDFYATVAKIVADTLAASSMQLLLSVTEDDPDRELRELLVFQQARPAGVIIAPVAKPRPETLALLATMEVVQLIRTQPRLAATAVLIDDRAGIKAGTEHLLALGHRRLAFIGGSEELSTGRERLAGFTDALRARKLSAAFTALGAPRSEFARHAVASMLATKPRPTAIILGSAELTLGALQALRAAKLSLPRDISLVGYHDPAWFELAAGGITTLRLPVDDIALTATSVLLAAIQHAAGKTGPQQPPAVVRFTPTLIVRGSTAKPST